MLKSGCQCRQVAERFGGASRARTDGLVVANDALSQLSYSPTKRTNDWTADLFYHSGRKAPVLQGGDIRPVKAGSFVAQGIAG
jgi:hypothetical protein